MKANINGQTVEGTPTEIVEYGALVSQQKNSRTFTRSNNTRGEPNTTSQDSTVVPAHGRRKTKWTISAIEHLFRGDTPVSCKTIRETLGMPKQLWEHGSGFAFRKRLEKAMGWHYDNHSAAFYKPGGFKQQHAYMQTKHDKNTRYAAAGRYFRVNREQAEQLVTATISPQTVVDDRPEFAKYWINRFSRDGVRITPDFFDGLINTLKDRDPARVKSYLRPYFGETQYQYVFLPFVLLEGRKICKLYGLKGHVVCRNNEVYLEE